MDTREENHIVLASIYRPSSSYIHMPISILFLDVEKESSTLHLSRPLVGFFHLVPDVLLAAPGYWLPDTCFTPAVCYFRFAVSRSSKICHARSLTAALFSDTFCHCFRF
ncbi:hypothetical protein MtrunA17_Chr5g0421021 [Medicago truncatula]|uniref:Uncharacterized protein n=1 Tax=Medicago truncatula TaxID=3880 RepID=A0A396HT85_MEDTR|nr:hypothetical protein MtrunA17_Chr5g0421021 [Medicago truncatula]